MDHLSLATILVIVGALLFSLSNGWNDAANAIATAVCTRVLTPFAAVVLGSLLNFVGALFFVKVANTIGRDMADPAFLGQETFLSAVLTATLWVTWCTIKGLPISCSHSLMGALMGAVVATAGWEHVKVETLWKMVYGVFTAPVAGFVLGILILSLVAHAFRRARPRTVNGIFGKLQIVSAGAMAFAHGTGDAQKAMGIIAGALVAGTHNEFEIPFWVRLTCSAVMGLGTAVGGWGVIKTLGTRLSHLRPWQGFAAEAASAATILSNTLIGIPLSTTHSITGAIMGVGAAQGLRTVRWGVGKKILYAWVLTFPVCILVGGLIAKGLQFVGLH